MYWFPKTKIGKVSFWIGVAAFIIMYLQYWVAMLFKISIPGYSGFLAVILILGAGISSVVALTKYKDKAILLFVSAFIGMLGLLLVIGEFVFPH